MGHELEPLGQLEKVLTGFTSKADTFNLSFCGILLVLFPQDLSQEPSSRALFMAKAVLPPLKHSPHTSTPILLRALPALLSPQCSPLTAALFTHRCIFYLPTLDYAHKSISLLSCSPPIPSSEVSTWHLTGTPYIVSN